MIATDAERISITGDHPNAQLRTHCPQTAHDRRSAAMDAVHAIRIEIIREARAAPDPAYEDDLLLRLALLAKNCLHLFQDAVVATARAPAHFLIGGVIHLRGRGIAIHNFCGGRHAFKYWSAASLISVLVNGMPWILFRPFASTRNSARIIWRSWPLFISGIKIVFDRFKIGPNSLRKGNRYRK